MNLEQEILAIRIKEKKSGTTSMSIENLIQCHHKKLIPYAHPGVNWMYYLKDHIREIMKENKTIKSFLYE